MKIVITAETPENTEGYLDVSTTSGLTVDAEAAIVESLTDEGLEDVVVRVAGMDGT